MAWLEPPSPPMSGTISTPTCPAPSARSTRSCPTKQLRVPLGDTPCTYDPANPAPRGATTDFLRSSSRRSHRESALIVYGGHALSAKQGSRRRRCRPTCPASVRDDCQPARKARVKVSLGLDLHGVRQNFPPAARHRDLEEAEPHADREHDARTAPFTFYYPRARA